MDLSIHTPTWHRVLLFGKYSTFLNPAGSHPVINLSRCTTLYYIFMFLLTKHPACIFTADLQIHKTQLGIQTTRNKLKRGPGDMAMGKFYHCPVNSNQRDVIDVRTVE